jgi:hypothetical protein
LGLGDFGGSVGKGKQTKFYFRPKCINRKRDKIDWEFTHSEDIFPNEKKAEVFMLQAPMVVPSLL